MVIIQGVIEVATEFKMLTNENFKGKMKVWMASSFSRCCSESHKLTSFVVDFMTLEYRAPWELFVGWTTRRARTKHMPGALNLSDHVEPQKIDGHSTSLHGTSSNKRHCFHLVRVPTSFI